MSNCVVYTSIFGNYDTLIDPIVYSKNLSYICFTNNKNMKSDIWDIRLVKPHIKNDSCRSARYVKICAHKFLSDFEYSMYIDGNKKLKAVPNIAEVLCDATIAFEPHPSRNCLYDEVEICKAFKKEDPETLNRQVRAYKSRGFPEQAGLYDSGLHFKCHNNPDIIDRCEEWWWHVKHYSTRDQVSLPMAFRGYPIKNISARFRYNLVSITELHPSKWSR